MQRLSETLEISYQNLIEGTGFFSAFQEKLESQGMIAHKGLLLC